MTKIYRATIGNGWEEEGEYEKTHTLYPWGIDVTIEEHLQFLSSPKKCHSYGVDNTYLRLEYVQKREGEGWPEMPEIDPAEEVEL